MIHLPCPSAFEQEIVKSRLIEDVGTLSDTAAHVGVKTFLTATVIAEQSIGSKYERPTVLDSA